MFYLKLMGAVLIVLSTSGFGYRLLQADKVRANALLEMKKALELLKSEIRYLHTPFAEAAESVGLKVTGRVSGVFATAAALAANKSHGTLSDIWTEAVRLNLTETVTDIDVDTFCALGKSLGYMDAPAQLSAIDMTISYIDTAWCAFCDTADKKGRMCMGFGVLGGMVLAVVLV